MNVPHPVRPVTAFAIVALILGACASATPSPDLERITYDSQPPPFCGRCETRKITVGVDDSVWIEDGHWGGHYSNWRVRHRSIRGEPGTYDRFRDALAPWRPAAEALPSYEDESCLSDDSGAIITWATSSGAVRRVLDHGCPSDKAIQEVVDAAVARLPIGR